ncbi:hypothetical protein [Pseudoduganella plicata]|uniref:hypothetical protein n=1 Tax=Pseudoduganella plicata TaxID=321984 RepID=UPI00141BA4B6|nr:hypothetical protein [Pseudoduganella plicata]
MAASDLVCAVPAFLGPSMPPGVDIVELAFPFLTYSMCMAWHAAGDDDPGLQWLRSQVQAVMADRGLAPGLA